MPEETVQNGGEEVSADASPGGLPAPGAAGAGYRVALDTYSGPLDLLLYLIRKEEVDIYDIPIAHIAEQYQQYIELMAEINVNVAGEFLVMAATLMEIKSRMLLPLEEGVEGEEEEDPRAELVRQLLEYKRYKDLARELALRAGEQALKFPRPGLALPPGAEQPGVEEGEPLEGVGLWELIDAFAKVLSETRIGPPQTRILERQRPIQEFRAELLQIITAERRIVFSRIFADCRSRDEMIAMFIALLELVRLQRVRLEQPTESGELYVTAAEAGEAPGTVRAQTQPAEAAEPAPPPQSPAARRPAALKPVDVLSGIEEEEESLGRARERIDAAIESAEAFLKTHHEQARPQEPAAEPDGVEDPPQRAAENPQNPGGGPHNA